MNPLQLTRNVRSLNRLRQIAMVLTRHGFGHVVTRLHLGRFVPVWMLRKRNRQQARQEWESTVGNRLVLVAGELGPTFIKLGQTLSSRPDLIPQSIIDDLKTLQDQVPPFDTEEAMRIISDELGGPILDAFGSIDPCPFASASIGQVYRATTMDGKPLVVKVRRPDIEETIRLDMQLSHALANSLESMMPEVRIYRPAVIVAEFEQTLMRELDYVNEASVTSRFHQAFENNAGIRIPKVFWEFSGSRVLTLQRLEGKSLGDLFQSEESLEKLDRPSVARRLAECFLKQVFEVGIFHCDPHPGNLLVDEHGSIGLIDFGQVGYITPEWMTQLVIIAYGCLRHEIDIVIDAFADIGALRSQVDRSSLSRSMQVLLDKYYGLPARRVDLSTLLNEFSEIVRRHDVTLPRDVILLIKAFGTVASITQRLDPEFDLLTVLEPRLKKTMSQRFSARELGRDTAMAGWHLLNIVRHAPRQLRDVMRRIGDGGWRLHVKHENIDRLANELDRSSNRIAFSVVIAAIIVGSSVVVAARTDETVLGFRVQTLGMLGYIIAGVLGLALTWAIYRSGRLH
ncbi:MAG: AarF/ABC1/UbiB kinase family protein [Planctomycetes bacterium]|nr:AarF/ABC1/UbiB kinase family protein [Planctomycetota bacterium]